MGHRALRTGDLVVSSLDITYLYNDPSNSWATFNLVCQEWRCGLVLAQKNAAHPSHFPGNRQIWVLIFAGDASKLGWAPSKYLKRISR
jgi:hypothetical protein